MKNFKKIFVIVLRISISIVVLIFLLHMVDFHNIAGHIRKASFSLLILACAVFSMNYILTFLRWRALFEVVSVHPPLKRLLTSFMGGVFFNLFLPTSIGGDFVRSIDLAANTGKPREVVATVIMDRLSGYVGLMILALFASLFGWRLVEDRTVFISLAVLVIMLAAILLILFNSFLYSKISGFLKNPGANKIMEAIAGVHEHLHNFRKHRKIIVKNVLLSICVQSITPIVFYIMACSMGIRAELIQFLILLPIIGAITLVPISVGGLGVREASVIFFFSKIGIVRDAAFAMSLFNFAFMAVYSAVAGIVYVFLARTRSV